MANGIFTDVCKQCGGTEFYESRYKNGAIRRQCKACHRAGGKYLYGHRTDEYAQERRQRAREYQLIRDYGITVEEYDEMLMAQDGTCAICELPPTDGKPLRVDHNHETGQVRGLLCHNCNVVLGLMHDDPTLLAAACLYIQEHDNGD